MIKISKKALISSIVVADQFFICFCWAYLFVSFVRNSNILSSKKRWKYFTGKEEFVNVCKTLLADGWSKFGKVKNVMHRCFPVGLIILFQNHIVITAAIFNNRE